MTDSCSSRQAAVAWLSWLSVKLLTSKQSRTFLGINVQGFRLQPTWSTALVVNLCMERALLGEGWHEFHRHPLIRSLDAKKLSAA